MADQRARATVEIIDRASPKIKKIKRELDSLRGALNRSGKAGDALKRAGRNLRDISRGSREAGRAAGRIRSSLRGLGNSASNAGRRVRRAISSAFNKAASTANRAIGRIKAGLSGIGRFMKTAALGVGAGAAVGAAALWKMGKAVVMTGAEFERLFVQLKALEGNSEKAKKAMAWITDFAQRTPLELQDVVKAYAMLKAFGIDPTNGSLQALTDTMAMQGLSADGLQGIILSLGQAYAIGKLQGDTFREMGTRGIPAAKLLAKALGKTESQILAMASAGKLGRKEIALLVALLGKRAKGASEEASKTFYGITSNISDLITHFKRLVAEAGIFDFVKQKLDEIRQKLDEMKQSGEMKKWAERLSNVMVKIGDAVWEAGKWLFTADLGGIGDMIRDAFKSLQEISADDLKSIFEDVRQSISGLASDIRTITNAVKTMVNGISWAYNQIKGMWGIVSGNKHGDEMHRLTQDMFKPNPMNAARAGKGDALRAISDAELGGRAFGTSAGGKMKEAAPAVGQRITDAMFARASAGGAAMGRSFANHVRAVIQQPINVAVRQYGSHAKPSSGSAGQQAAPRGVDAPAPLPSQ